MADRGSNFGLKDEIIEYWNARAENFDRSPGHGISPGAERTAWQTLVTARLGALAGREVLELASGTGEFTSLLLGAGARVTGLDLSPGMLAKARAKVPQARLFIGDAENTREAPESYDAVVCRHLVWTLTDPVQAFSDWFRVLRPGGRLLIVDGDWVRQSLPGRIRLALGRGWMRLFGPPPEKIDWAANDSIMRQVHFRDGLRPGPLAALLEGTGFAGIETGSIAPIRRAQRKAAGFPRSLTVGTYRDFWVGAVKPQRA